MTEANLTTLSDLLSRATAAQSMATFQAGFGDAKRAAEAREYARSLLLTMAGMAQGMARGEATCDPA